MNQMKKRVFLIHGWGGYPEEGWRPWLKKELEKRNFEVFIPAMPNTNFPLYEQWINHLQHLIGKPQDNDILVGHSLGCITILRFLEKLKGNKKIKGSVFVAGFTDDLGFKELSSFFVTKIDFPKIKKHCQKFIALHSDNDPYVSLKYGNIFKEKLNGELIIEHNKKHFSGDDGILNLPSALSSVVELAAY